MHYVHQAQLSEIDGLPTGSSALVHFWTGNVQHSIAQRTETVWSVLESSGALVGEFVAAEDGFAVVEDHGAEPERFGNWRSAVRNIVRRGLHAV